MVDDGYLDAGDARSLERVAQVMVAVSGGRVHGVRAEGPRPQQGDTDRRPAGRVERRPPQRQLAESHLDPGPRRDLQVLDHAAPAIVGDRIEAHRHDTALAEQLVAGRPCDVVQHRHERGPRPQRTEIGVRRAAQHEHDVLSRHLVSIGEADAIFDRVRVGLEPQPGAVAALEHDLVGAEPRERSDQLRQEIAPLTRVFGHPEEPDRSSHRTGTLSHASPSGDGFGPFRANAKSSERRLTSGEPSCQDAAHR